jgi:hypothetical protein
MELIPYGCSAISVPASFSPRLEPGAKTPPGFPFERVQSIVTEEA